MNTKSLPLIINGPISILSSLVIVNSSLPRQRMLMKIRIARFAICTGCNNQFIICSYCDHGNIYCSYSCSFIARKRLTKMACQRYQTTQNGRHHHAQRQKRYCARKNIVTHHSSKVPLRCVSLPKLTNKLTQRDTKNKMGRYFCHFCGKSCLEFVRQSYLRQNPIDKMKKLKSCPQGP